jgi:hypothetical protein
MTRDDDFEPKLGRIRSLRRRELSRVAGQLSDELCLDYADVRRGERIEGVYRRSIELASG